MCTLATPKSAYSSENQAKTALPDLLPICYLSATYLLPMCHQSATSPDNHDPQYHHRGMGDSAAQSNQVPLPTCIMHAMPLPRRRLVQLITATVLLAGVLLAPARPVWACSCAMPHGPDLALSQATAVFSGIVQSIVDIGRFTLWDRVRNWLGIYHRSFREPREVAFGVATSWKGVAETPVIVRTGYGGGDCGFSFRIGGQYLVYAYDHQGTLTTNTCLRTTDLSQAPIDLAYLQTQPTLTVTPAPPRMSLFWLGAAVCGLLILALAAFTAVVWRRRAASPRSLERSPG